MSKIKVAVLMGGASSEREVSLWTGEQVLNALEDGRYDAFAVDTLHLSELLVGAPPAGGHTMLPDPGLPLFTGINRPDVCFLALHGRFGEDGTIQGLLELLGIRYTGSGVLASALAMNKAMSKQIFEHAGIPTPPALAAAGAAAARRIAVAIAAGDTALRLPLMVKADLQGSTLGVYRVRRMDELAPAVEKALEFGPGVLFERMVDGVEITAPVLGSEDPQALPLVEIVPPAGIFDYQAKYSGATQEIVPARLPASITARAQELALRAHQALGCSGYSRTDMIVAEDEVWVLETNTLPGLTANSLLPRSAAAAGYSFPRLLDRIIELALE